MAVLLIQQSRPGQHCICYRVARSLAPRFQASTARGHNTRVLASAGSRGSSGLDIEGYRPTSAKAWEIVSSTLRRNNIRFLTPGEAETQASRGVPVIDIRPPTEYQSGHIQNSINVPLYQSISGWDSRSIARRIGYAFFGVFNGTEVNPNFLSELEAAAPDKDAGAILVCNLGGSLQLYDTNTNGQQSRSLMAAYEMINNGWSRLSILDGGFSAWRREGRDIEVD